MPLASTHYFAKSLYNGGGLCYNWLAVYGSHGIGCKLLRRVTDPVTVSSANRQIL